MRGTSGKKDLVPKVEKKKKGIRITVSVLKTLLEILWVKKKQSFLLNLPTAI